MRGAGFPAQRGGRRLLLLLPALLAALPTWAPIASAARLCMLPAAFPFDEDDERRARIEQIVAREFEAASIPVAPSAEVRKLLEVVDERSGRIFDPETGRIDDAKESLYLDDIERSVAAELGCTGFVQVGLHQVLAWYDGHHANWDGRRTPINSGARIAGRVVLGILSGVYVQEQGWVPALSLSIEVSNLRYEDVAFRVAGVEPLMNFSVSRKQDLLPRDQWLKDEALVETAIGAALGSDLADLKGNGRPGEAPLPTGFSWE
ncbi:MAG: hypothetical protein IPK00_04585 [Deltaproteobacteria bacterium]|nr:hypothetical protein [Deltaproteobacteria bacterium]